SPSSVTPTESLATEQAMRRPILALVLAFSLVREQDCRTAAPPVAGSSGYTREQTDWTQNAMDRIRDHTHAGRFAAAERVTREATGWPGGSHGERHGHTNNIRREADRGGRLAKSPAEKRRGAGRYLELTEGVGELLRVRPREAEKRCRDALKEVTEALG